MPTVGEMDFKGQSVAEETGQPETETKEETTEETKVETQEETQETKTEDVESLKERLAKVEEEKENYKKGMLKYKDLSLNKKEEKEESEEIEYPEWDENSKKFQEQTLSQAEKRAEEKARKIVEDYNEKAAIAQFVEKHSLTDESVWGEIVANYSPTHGKTSIQDVMKDLDRAYILTRYEKGELNNIVQEATEKGKKQGKAEAQVANESSVSKTTQKTVKDGQTLSSGALIMAERLRISPEKLSEAGESGYAETKF